MTRKPAREHYDAHVDLFPPRRPPRCAFALVKCTHALASGTPRLAAEPLVLTSSLIEPGREYAGSDDMPFKPATDVVVIGSAFAPEGGAVSRLEVGLRVGSREKRIVVWGRRRVEWGANEQPYIGAAEPFQELPLTYANAYGGTHRRVPLEPGRELLGELLKVLPVDHPGMYPRNPFGKGYLVRRERIDDIELPNLEDPNDPLTAERLCVGDPRLWYRQPLPCCFAWVPPISFPRLVYSGQDAWYPGPQDEALPEVRLGHLPSGYRDLYEPHQRVDRRRQQQEAGLGLVFDELLPGTPFVLEHMHPDKAELSFELPAAPSIELRLESKIEQARAHPIHVVLEPSRERISVTYSVVMRELPRIFIPGVHGKIPLCVRVDGDIPVEYEYPPSVRAPPV